MNAVAQFLTRRAASMALSVRTKPASAPAARNWFALAARYAERCGDARAAYEIRWAERNMLEHGTQEGLQ